MSFYGRHVVKGVHDYDYLIFKKNGRYFVKNWMGMVEESFVDRDSAVQYAVNNSCSGGIVWLKEDVCELNVTINKDVVLIIGQRYGFKKIPEYIVDVYGGLRAKKIIESSQYDKRTGIIVPMYIYPWDAGSGTWSSKFTGFLDTLKKYRIPKIVVVNPENGPGAVRDAVWYRAIRMLKGAGATVVGYIYIDYCNRNISEVFHDINAWYDLYPEIDGLFIDNWPWEDNETYYTYCKKITMYARGRGFCPVIANPGVIIAGGYYQRDTADIFVIWDTDTYPTEDDLKGGDWEWSHMEIPYWMRAGIVHSQSSLDINKVRLMAKYLGYVYITHDTLPNPWDEISNYLEYLMEEFQNRILRRTGIATFSGDGVTTTFNIPHGLPTTPSKYGVCPLTPDAHASKTITVDDTNITITFDTAPPSGTNNIKFGWWAEI